MGPSGRELYRIRNLGDGVRHKVFPNGDVQVYDNGVKGVNMDLAVENLKRLDREKETLERELALARTRKTLDLDVKAASREILASLDRLQEVLEKGSVAEVKAVLRAYIGRVEFFPIEKLPALLRPLSYALPLTYGADVLHGAIRGAGRLPLALDFVVLAAFCALLFAVSLRNIRRKWIV